MSAARLSEAREHALEALGSFFEALERSAVAPVEPPLVACETCGLDARTVRRAVARGQLRAVKIGRSWYASPADLHALLPAPRREQLPLVATAANEVEAPKDGAEELLESILDEVGAELVPRTNVAASGRRARR